MLITCVVLTNVIYFCHLHIEQVNMELTSASLVDSTVGLILHHEISTRYSYYTL
jgi:hypothetical protein